MTTDAIFTAIERELGLSMSELQSCNRTRNYTDARVILILLVYEYNIARAQDLRGLLCRHRCSIIHLHNLGINLLDTDKVFTSKYNAVKRRVNSE